MEVPGPQHPPDPEAKPIEYFSIFFFFDFPTFYYGY